MNTKSEFRPSMSDYDPITNRLYRDKWALRETTFRPSLHLNFDEIVRCTNEDPAACATPAEIAALITALEKHHHELGEKLKELKRSNPLARQPDESERAYRARVPQELPPEQKYVLVWLRGDRSDVLAHITVLRAGCQPQRCSGNRDERTRDLLRPFQDRWSKVHFANLDAEEARVRPIIEATPVDDEAWEQYQLSCDRRDAYEEERKAWHAESEALGQRRSIDDYYRDMFMERVERRATEITRARHATATTREVAW